MRALAALDYADFGRLSRAAREVGVLAAKDPADRQRSIMLSERGSAD